MRVAAVPGRIAILSALATAHMSAFRSQSVEVCAGPPPHGGISRVEISGGEEAVCGKDPLFASVNTLNADYSGVQTVERTRNQVLRWSKGCPSRRGGEISGSGVWG